jgi:hypothetical protein
MGLEAILQEVEHLNGVGTRLEGLADEHPPMSEGLIGVAGSVRGAATILSLLVATKGDGHEQTKVQ